MYFLTSSDLKLIRYFTGKTIILEFSHIDYNLGLYDGHSVVSYYNCKMIGDFFYIRLSELAIKSQYDLLNILETLNKINEGYFSTIVGDRFICTPADVLTYIELDADLKYNYFTNEVTKSYIKMTDYPLLDIYRDADGIIVHADKLRTNTLQELLYECKSNITTSGIQIVHCNITIGTDITIKFKGDPREFKYSAFKWYLDYLASVNRLDIPYLDSDDLAIEFTLRNIVGTYVSGISFLPKYNIIEGKRSGNSVVYRGFNLINDGCVSIIETKWGIIGVVDEDYAYDYTADMSVNNTLYLDECRGLDSIEVIDNLGIIIKTDMQVVFNAVAVDITPAFQLFNMTSVGKLGNLFRFEFEGGLIFIEESVVPHCIIPLQVRDFVSNSDNKDLILNNILNNDNYSGISVAEEFEGDGDFCLY